MNWGYLIYWNSKKKPSKVLHFVSTWVSSLNYHHLPSSIHPQKPVICSSLNITWLWRHDEDERVRAVPLQPGSSGFQVWYLFGFFSPLENENIIHTLFLPSNKQKYNKRGIIPLVVGNPLNPRKSFGNWSQSRDFRNEKWEYHHVASSCAMTADQPSLVRS